MISNARLPRSLEEEPLGLQHPVFESLERDFVLRVVLLDEVGDDRVGLPIRRLRLTPMLWTGRTVQNKPDNEVAILVVDQGRDATIRTVLEILLGLLYVGGEVVVDVAVI